MAAPLIALLLAAQLAAGSILPAPSGPHAVGRITAWWVDRTRPDPQSTSGAYRELIVDVWYPAEREDVPRAEYLDFPGFEDLLGEDVMRRQFGRAYEALQDNAIETHAADTAPFAATIRRAPLLIFSHRNGTSRELYTAMLEDLASHGFIVAAMSTKGEALATVFPDRRSIGRSGTRTPTAMRVGDIRFVLNVMLNAGPAQSPELPFAARIDTGRISAFGDGEGGAAAVEACQADRRLRACFIQSGDISDMPFLRADAVDARAAAQAARAQAREAVAQRLK